MNELEKAYMKLLVLYFDCEERVDHTTLKMSIDEIIRLMEVVKDEYTNTKHKMI